MNLFVGGRRLTLVAQVATLVAVGWSILSDEPYVQVDLITRGPDKPFQLNYADCPSNAREELKRYKDTSGISDITINFCFDSVMGTGFLPYAIDKDGSWSLTEEKFGDEMNAYVQRRIADFNFSSPVGKQAALRRDQMWWKVWRDDAERHSQFGGVFLVVVTSFSYMLGWIVRGFAGIPSGADRKPKE